MDLILDFIIINLSLSLSLFAPLLATLPKLTLTIFFQK